MKARSNGDLRETKKGEIVNGWDGQDQERQIEKAAFERIVFSVEREWPVDGAARNRRNVSQ